MTNHTPFLLLLSLFFLTQNANAQDFAAVDDHARNTADSKAENVEKLAQHLTKKFDSEKEKARAIYVWMAMNIRYNLHTIDPESSQSIEQRIKKQQPERVLQSRRAVCEGYANLFHALCKEAGLRSIIVIGCTKNREGKIAPVGHAWNLVAIDGQWFPVDITWGAGGVDGQRNRYVQKLSEEFFLADAKAFIQHHLPNDPLFQLLAEPVGFDVFKKEKQVAATAPNEAQNLTMTAQLDAHFLLEEDEQLAASCERAVDFDPTNGFCNFTLANREYRRALKSYNLFSTDCQAVFDKKIPLTTPMVDGWEKHLNDYRYQLRLAEKYLANVRSGDPISAAAKSSKDAIDQAWKISKQTEAQFKDYRQYLARTGN